MTCLPCEFHSLLVEQNNTATETYIYTGNVISLATMAMGWGKPATASIIIQYCVS